MSEIFQKLKTPIIIIAVLFAGLVSYNLFIKKPESQTLLKTTAQTDVKAPGSNFLPILLEVQGVTLDEKLFLDPVFRALVDWSLPIVPETLGKNNPFSNALSLSGTSSVESLGFKDTSTSTPVVKRTVTPPAKPPVKK